MPRDCPAMLSTVSYMCWSGRRNRESTSLYRSDLHTSEYDWMRKVIGPEGVVSLEPASPVGGRNLMKASHSQSSSPRLHFVHIGRMSSPAIVSEPENETGSSASQMKHCRHTFLAFAAAIQASGPRSSTFLACRGRGFIRHTMPVEKTRFGRT